MAAGQFSLYWLWTSNQHKRSSQVIFKSRSHSPLLVFFCWHHPFPEEGIPYSPVSMQSLSRMILISAAWVTWQPRSHHWRVEHSDWSALVMWGGSQGVGRGILANSPTHNGEKLFSKRGVQASNLYLPQRMNRQHNYCTPHPPVFHSVTKGERKNILKA